MPPVDGLILTPGLASFYSPEYAGVYYVMFDIGIKIASSPLGDKIRVAYRAYTKLINLLLSSEHAVGGKALVVIPDDWELNAHIKLTRAWLGSYERRVIHARLIKHGYDVIDALIIRRYIRDRLTLVVDFSPYKDFIKTYGESLIYAIPANVSSAMVNTDIKCRFKPSECMTHISLGVNALLSELNKPWIHLLGPPHGLLKMLINDVRITSTDTTAHTYNLMFKINRFFPLIYTWLVILL
jgi:hypothetical protein